MHTTRRPAERGPAAASRRRLVTASLLILFLSGPGALLLRAQEPACADCHGNVDRLREAMQDESRPIQPLLIDVERHKQSFHGGQGCTDCHFEFESHPHPEEALTPACTDCHEDVLEHYSASIHGTTPEGAEAPNAPCTACHGVHDDFKKSDRRSRLHPLNVHKTCGTCHDERELRHPGEIAIAGAKLGSYFDDVHGRGIVHAGLNVSANCVSCHGGHDIRPAGDPESRLHHDRIDDTCGSCHAGIQERYKTSVHHTAKIENGEIRTANCNDCHHPHEIERASDAFRAGLSRTCSKCHEQRAGTFIKSYHGRVSSFGYGEKVANCADCHGSHEILPASDPNSMVHEGNLVATCGKCHEGAHESFVQFQVHADFDTPDDNAAVYWIKVSMEGLLLFVFLFGGIHASLWLVRSLAAKEWLHRATFKKTRGTRHVRRWSGMYVGLHAAMMSSVTVCGLTGLPLHFSEAPWSIAAMRFLGGPGTAGLLHRVAAFVMTATFFVYLVHMVYRLVVKREKGIFSGPNTMLPRVQDLKDVGAMVRWFLFLGPRPKFDRWTYWEKFDYWAVFWGMLIIGGSGVLLWFPVATTNFVPGWMLNAATVVHGHEALLALGFLFTIHIFHGNLRPDKFPVDLLFYTGRMTEEEFKRERPKEYERALEGGYLDALFDREPRRVRQVMGMVVAGIVGSLGLAMVWAMVATML